MRIPAYGLLLGVSMILASGVPVDLPEIAPQLLQGGALAVLAWTVWYMLARTFPAHTEALKEQRDAFLEFLRQERETRK